MRLDITKLGIKIIPETVQDELYIEKFLGLKNENDTIRCKRRNAHGLNCIAHIDIEGEQTVSQVK